MPDSRFPAAAPPAYRSRTRWDVEIGRLRFAVTRTREAQGRPDVGGPGRRARPGWPLAIGAFAAVSGLGLAVMGATAAIRPELASRYMVSLPVPAAAGASLHRPHRDHHAVAARTAPAMTAADDDFAPGDAPYVARALRTGAFQEWEDADGQRRFITAGPAQAGAGRTCRELALLVRLADGGSHVHAARRCTTASVSDGGAVAQDDDGEPSSPDAPTRQ